MGMNCLISDEKTNDIITKPSAVWRKGESVSNRYELDKLHSAVISGKFCLLIC